MPSKLVVQKNACKVSSVVGVLMGEFEVHFNVKRFA